MAKIALPFRARAARTVFRNGLIAGMIVALFLGIQALYLDQNGQFSEDPEYLLHFIFAIFVLVFGPFLFAAIVADILASRRGGASFGLRPRFVVARILAWSGVIVGGAFALFIGQAALSHNPMAVYSNDPAYLLLLMFSWFVVIGGPILLSAALAEAIYRLRQKRR